MPTIDWDTGPEDYQPFQFPTTPTSAPPTGAPRSAAEQTYANQTEARNAYYKTNPNQAPVFTPPQQQGLDRLVPPTPPAPPQAPQGGGNAQAIIRQWQQTHGPHEPLDGLIAELQRNGIDAAAFLYGSTPSGNEIKINGQQYKVKTGDNASWWEPSMGEGGGGAGNPRALTSSYMAGFNDPSTRYMEQYYKAQLGAFEAQRAQQEQANAALKARMPEIQAATDRLIQYLTSRATQLQGAPYTGAEAEILRTQALDPIENDRQASKKRALENIGARGLTPESGISQELLNRVDAGYDRSRAGAQNELAYRTINEKRSREQEAQQLLASIPQIQRAGASGDLEFLQALDRAVNAPRMQGMPMVSQLQQLPSLALRDANQTLANSPNPYAAFQNASQMNANQQGTDAAFWAMLFEALGV